MIIASNIGAVRKPVSSFTTVDVRDLFVECLPLNAPVANPDELLINCIVEVSFYSLLVISQVNKRVDHMFGSETRKTETRSSLFHVSLRG